MTYNRKLLFGLLALGFLLSCTQTPEQRAKDTTVLIITGDADSSIGNGTGFFVEPDKIATNIHVVAGARMIFVVGRKKVYNIEKVAGYDPERDLVTLGVSGEGSPLELGGQIGDVVFAVGYPGGEYKVTEVKVHGIRNSDKQLRLVAPDFPASRGNSVLASGNSGGPILNSTWQVIGVATSGGGDFSFASDLSEFKVLDEENLSDWQVKSPILAYVYKRSANKKLNSQDYNSAIKGLDKTIELYQYADAYDKRGQAKGNLGRHKDAIEDYYKAIDLIPDYFATYYNLGNAKRQSGDYAGAIQDYNKALELNPHDTTTYLNRGVVKAAKHDYKGAIQDYTDAIKLKPKDAELARVYYNLGNAKRQSGDYAGAIQDYTDAIELKPKDTIAYAYLKRGAARQSSMDYAGAIQDYTDAIKLQKLSHLGYAEAHRNLSIAKKALGQDGNVKLDQAKAYYYEGKANSNSSNYQEAIKDFDKSIELNPDCVEAYYALGNAKLESKDYNGAIQDYKEVTNRKPDYVEAYYSLGVTYSHLKHYEMALDHFDKAIMQKQNFAEAYYNRGNAYRLRGEEGDYQKAVENYTEAIKVREDFADAYRDRGLVNEKSGQVDAAKIDSAFAHWIWGLEAYERAEYQEALKYFKTSVLELETVNPSEIDLDEVELILYSARTEEKLGKSKADMGNLANNLKRFIDVFLARTYNYQAMAKGKLSKSKADMGEEGAWNLYQEAIEDHDDAIDLDPENALYYRNRGLTKFLRAAIRDSNGMIEDYRATIEDCTKAIKRESDYADAYNLRGLTRCLLGYAKATQGDSKEAREQYNLAREDFKQTITINPDNASYHRKLGLANASLGKAKAAINAFEKAKQLKEKSEKQGK